MTQKALVIVDVQNDFCEGGALPVAGGAAVAAAISDHLHRRGGEYAVVVATLDWHVDPGAHFSATPDFVDSWPAHCVADSPGARPHPALETDAVSAWFTKGEHAAAYSGFAGATPADPPGTAAVSLDAWLKTHAVEELDVVGLATDHCVRATALDAAAAGYRTRVLLPLTAGVAVQSTRDAMEEFQRAGVELVAKAP